MSISITRDYNAFLGVDHLKQNNWPRVLEGFGFVYQTARGEGHADECHEIMRCHEHEGEFKCGTHFCGRKWACLAVDL